MYAIFDNGGKQYKVKIGQLIKLEKCMGNIGDIIYFKKILMIYDKQTYKIGTPFLKASITAELLSHNKTKKIQIIKFNRRKHFRKTQGHRQNYTLMKIININNKI
ncbi:50S ribosomal protein L21 [Enterobacteriaceae endosymbiont of Neohaemonia nigricornis]|nr:50S ribosomal protein L21 [Enterobacteriaceae endosymbiont of Neohaemonia nigricornis]QJC30635.1 50S ribosomal protein L21 [Enterobacteriaceae endosymbiont of Neohaemonia nigricornis]